MKHIVTLAVILSMPLAAQVENELDPARQLHTAPFGKGGTWNLYEAVHDSITWSQANKTASEMVDPLGGTGKKAHLVSIHSMAEQFFTYYAGNTREIWIGLTDNERFGGKEAYTFMDRGWAWTSGEPVTFTFWSRSQPDNWLNRGGGEDAVECHYGGQWFDAGSGADGENPQNYYYVVEWETQSPKPVPGAQALQPVWPKDATLGKVVPGKWSVQFCYGIITDAQGASRMPRILQEAGRVLEVAFPGPEARKPAGVTAYNKLTTTPDSPLLHLAMQDRNRSGLFPGDAAPKWELSEHSGPGIASVLGTIAVKEAGTYTFAVSCEDGFALRIGGKPWKAVHGRSCIDPLDQTVMCQPNGNFNAQGRGVLDLPAGEHLVEGLWFTQQSGSEFQVSSAKGEFENEGDTDQWRLLGHKARGKVNWPGIDEEGWTVECTKSKGHAAANAKVFSLQDGLLALSLGKNLLVENNVAAINYGESGGEAYSRFPEAKPFPNDVKNQPEDIFATRARGKLVIPADGTYWIGIYADERGALRIKGQAWDRIIQAAQPSKSAPQVNGDTFSFHAWHLPNDARAIGEITLKKGTYEIEAMHVDDTGSATFAVFGAPAGYPPKLLMKGGAGSVEDHDGLQLAE